MTSNDKKPNKGGRPRKYPSDLARPTITFRVRTAIHEKLKETAAERELSLSEEVERRVTRSIELEERVSKENRDVGEAVALALTLADEHVKELGLPWSQARYYKFARAEVILASMMGTAIGGPQNRLINSPDDFAAYDAGRHDQRNLETELKDEPIEGGD